MIAFAQRAFQEPLMQNKGLAMIALGQFQILFAPFEVSAASDAWLIVRSSINIMQ